MRSNKKKRPVKQRRDNRRRRIVARSGPTKIPMNNCDLTMSKKIRYVVLTQGHTKITRGAILNLIVVPFNATNAYALLKAVKIQKIECWSISTSSSAPLGSGEEIIITWSSSLGKELTERGSQMGIVPAYVKTRPPKDSLSSYWTNLSTTGLTNVLVDIFMPSVGGLIDITYELQFINDSPARTITITSGPAGSVSYNNFTNYSNQGYQDYDQ